MTLIKTVNKLLKAGYNIETITTTEGTQAIMIDTNYTGEYPTRETHLQHLELQRIAAKCNCGYEPRGHKTAAWLTFN